MKDTTFKDAFKLAYTPKEDLTALMADAGDKALREYLRLMFEGMALAVPHIPNKWLRLDLHRAAQYFKTFTSHMEGDNDDL